MKRYAIAVALLTALTAATSCNEPDQPSETRRYSAVPDDSTRITVDIDTAWAGQIYLHF